MSLRCLCLCVVFASFATKTTVGGTTGDPELERWFVEWAEQNTPSAIAATYESRQKLTEHPAEVYRGSWAARYQPGFAQYLSFEMFVAGRKTQFAEYGWDALAGRGRVYNREANSLKGQAIETMTSPAEFGAVLHPSTAQFFCINDRALARHVKLVAPWAQAISEDGNQIVVCVRDDKARSAVAFVMDRSRRQPFVEYRLYTDVSKLPVEIRNPDLGPPIPLPSGLEDLALFCKIEVTASEAIGNRSTPVEWTVYHCLLRPGEEVFLKIDPESIRFDAAALREDYLAELAPGTKVYDSAEGSGYVVDSAGELGKSEFIAERDLDALLAAVHVVGPASHSNKTTAIPTGCSANSVYLALALLGRPQPLAPLTSSLGIERGEPESTLAQIQSTIEATNARALAYGGDLESLKRPGSKPAIVHAIRTVRMPGGEQFENGHFVVIDDYDANDDSFRVFDAPKFPYRTTAENIEKVWTGHAIVLDEVLIDRILTSDRSRRRVRAVSLAIAGLSAVLAVILGVRSRWKR